mgnify:CR=1 FL=1
MVAAVYMLRCADGSYYVGSTSAEDQQRRLLEHQSGAYRGYTFSRRPVELVWSQAFDRITDAHATEHQVKGWSRAKKEALIRGDWAAIRELAKRR